MVFDRLLGQALRVFLTMLTGGALYDGPHPGRQKIRGAGKRGCAGEASGTTIAGVARDLHFAPCRRMLLECCGLRPGRFPAKK